MFKVKFPDATIITYFVSIEVLVTHLDFIQPEFDDQALEVYDENDNCLGYIVNAKFYPMRAGMFHMELNGATIRANKLEDLPKIETEAVFLNGMCFGWWTDTDFHQLSLSEEYFLAERISESSPLVIVDHSIEGIVSQIKRRGAAKPHIVWGCACIKNPDTGENIAYGRHTVGIYYNSQMFSPSDPQVAERPIYD